MKKLWPRFWYILLVVVPLVLQFVWFKDGLIRGSGESGLPFYNLNQQFEFSKTSWSSYLFGNARGLNISSVPTDFLFAKLESLGIANFAIQAIFQGLIFLIAGLGIVLLTRLYFPSLSSKYLFLAATFYWFNPLSLVNVWNRFLYNFMVFWAFLPLSVYVFTKGIKEKEIKYSLILAILTGLFSYALSGPSFTILLWMVLTIILSFYFLTEKTLRKFLLAYFATFIVTFVGVNFWWISQLVTFVYSSGYAAAVDDFFSSSSNLSSLELISNLLGSFYNNYIYLHGTFFTTGPSWARYFIFLPIKAGSYFISFVILWLIYKHHTKKNVLFFSILFTLALFLIKGLNPPFGWVFKWLFVRSTIFQVFRNPFEKFGFLLILAAGPLFALGLKKISTGLKKPYWETIIFSSSLFYILVFWGFPFFSGSVFKGVNPTNKTELSSNQVKVPKSYDRANLWLNSIDGEFRFLSVPIGGEGITYNWEHPYSGVELSSTLFGVPNISFNTTVPYYSQIAKEISHYQLTEDILAFTPFTNSRYILVRSDVLYKADRLADPQTTTSLYQQFAERGLLKKAFEDGDLKFYEVPDQYIWPKIYTTRKIVISDSSDFARLSSYLPNFPKDKTAIVSTANKDSIEFNNIVIFPKDIFKQKITTPLPRDLSEDDILSTLFHTKHLPGSWYYSFVRLKEKIQSFSNDDYLGAVIYKNGLLSKRAVEIYKLRVGGASPKVIKKAEEDYEKQLSTLKRTFFELTREDSPISRLIKDTLVKEWVLFDRSGSGLADSLSDILVVWGFKPRFELPVAESDYVIASFDVQVPGTYIINKSDLGEEIEFYLDGHEFNENIVDLEPGLHEVAYLTKGLITTEEKLFEDSLVVSSESTPEWIIEVSDKPTKYILEFDYRFVMGDRFKINYEQNVDPIVQPLFSNEVNKEESYHGWKKFEKEFTTTPGVASGKLTIMPSEIEVCGKRILFIKRCKNEGSKYEVEIENLSLNEINTPEPSLILENNTFENLSTQINWEKKDPTSYQITINKPESSRELLVFSELYNSSWKAVYSGGDVIEDSNHILVNGYANAWILDKNGDYTIILRYEPQGILEKAFVASKLSVAGLLIYLIMNFFIKRISKNAN